MNSMVVRRGASGVLSVKIPSRGIECDVVPVRLFPITAPHRQIGLFRIGPDGRPGEELAVLADDSQVDEAGRALIEEELNKTSPLTVVSRINFIRQVEKIMRWQVESNRGRTTFDVKDLKDIFVIHADQQRIVMVKDTSGNRFVIDPAGCDARSRMLLEAYT